MEANIYDHGGPYGGGKYRKNSLIPYTVLGFSAPLSRLLSTNTYAGTIRSFHVAANGDMFVILESRIIKFDSNGQQTATVAGSYYQRGHWDEASQTLFVTADVDYSTAGYVYAFNRNLSQIGLINLGKGVYDVYVRSGVIYALCYDKLVKLTFNGTTFTQVLSGPISTGKVGYVGSSIVVMSNGDVYVNYNSSGGGYPTIHKFNNSLVYQSVSFSTSREDEMVVDAQDKLYHGGSKYNVGASITTAWTRNSSGYGMVVDDNSDTVLMLAYYTGLEKLNKAGAIQWTLADPPNDVFSGNNGYAVQAVYNPVTKVPVLYSNVSGSDRRVRRVDEFYKIVV
jgi:hypothetical protein